MISLVVGALFGLALAAAPDMGPVAISDPVLLGSIWFVRPSGASVVVPVLVHFCIGAGVGVLGRLVPSIRPQVVLLVTVAINGAATLLDNAYGAGVMGVGWWLLGSLMSAALMLVGAWLARQALRRPALS